MTEPASDAPAAKPAVVKDGGDAPPVQEVVADTSRGGLSSNSLEPGDRERLASLSARPTDIKLPTDGKLNLGEPDPFASVERSGMGMAARPGEKRNPTTGAPEGPKPEFKTTAEQVNNIPTGDGKVTERKLVNENRSLEGKSPDEIKAAFSAERERLLKDVSPDKLQSTKDAMAALEDPNRQPPLSQAELARIYKATSDLIEGKDGKQPPVLNDQQRQLMAAGILDNVAHTKDIDQGFNSTCQVTAMEENMATKDAAAYAEMMSDLGRNMQDAGKLHGRDVVSWQAPNGQTVIMDKQSVMPDREALNGQVDGQRNYSSQMFDNMIVNQFWQSKAPGSLYLKDSPSQPGDTGERLLDSQGNVRGDSPGLVATQLAEMGRNLGLGSKDKPFMITNANDGSYNTDGVARVGSEADLQKVLDQADANGGYPLMIMVHTGHAMFRGTENMGGAGGWHMVSITGKNPDGTYRMSNQWGSGQDQNVKVGDLYQATRGPEQGAEGYTGRGTNPNGGGGGGGGGSDGGNNGGNGNGNNSHKEGMLPEKENKEKEMAKTGKEADEAAQRQIDAIKAKIASLKGQAGHEAEIMSLEGQITILSSQAYRN